ncbi:hypothetical protein PoB_006987800 [Plakobranchus ocellatus]|uniref:Uncharacterized protein n=1 Tax=Plakobranchus ocellatus TaxID=259542 RepID=A0AAV4DH41_9GAST|nr:hypothetical protein PoB_006987800 [Plakobranchus ocellatus]
MDKLKEDVRTQKPDKLYREADVLYGPKKKRVIYDGKHRKKGNGMNMQTVRTGTFADKYAQLKGWLILKSIRTLFKSSPVHRERYRQSFCIPKNRWLT